MRKYIKNIITVFTVAFTLLISITFSVLISSAAGEAIYSFDASTGVLTVSGEGVISQAKVRDYDYENIKTVEIKSGITGVDVEAFLDCKNIEKVIISNTVAKITPSAFSNCIKLSYFDVDSNNENYSSDEGVLLSKSKRVIIEYPQGKSGTEYTVDENVVKISAAAFQNCVNLKTINLPNELYTIETAAFDGCTSLTSIVIPSQITGIDRNCFDGCTSLSSVKFCGKVTSIGDGAFRNCTSLANIDIILSTVTSIGEEAFGGCTGLTSITIPENVKTIGKCAFKDCTELTNISIPNGVQKIGYDAFYGCSKLASVSISESVTSIDNDAFRNCNSLVSFDVSSSNPSYSSENGVLFDKDKTTLIKYPSSKVDTSYEIPEGVTTIIARSFENCTNLQEITIPTSVTAIKSNAILGCSNLKLVYYYGSSEQWNKIQIGAPNLNFKENTKIHYESTDHTYKNGACEVCGYKCVHNFENGICSVCGSVSFDDVKVNVAGEKTVEYHSKLKIIAAATGVNPSHKLAIFIDGKRVATGSTNEVSFTVEKVNGDINYTVKVVDENNNIVKDVNGNEMSKDGGKISCNSGFFAKIIAFFKEIFGKLPNVILKP